MGNGSEGSGGERPPRLRPAAADEDPNVSDGYASPPCFMHELAEWNAPDLSPAEVVALVAALRQATGSAAARAGALYRRTSDAPPEVRSLLGDMARESARCSAILASLAARAGGTSPGGIDAGDGRDGATHAEGLALLRSAHRDAVDRLRDALPRIADDGLRRELQAVLDLLRANLARAEAAAP